MPWCPTQVDSFGKWEDPDRASSMMTLITGERAGQVDSGWPSFVPQH